ncbi:WhiB family transcriptional regulator [Actinokineospora pegani]|uniref:WhiB family transcriptional regulator n=1 Tax=Actinokineospora pegani TaxID=2654637 RepID=UPI0012EACA5B|nr:WhiB family transcriptional regulator [Actinokineospora pegani]
MSETRRLVGIAYRLDRLRWVPSELLRDVVVDQGACMAPGGDEPVAGSDRELAARVCAGCPVVDECLELELRTGGPETVGVWGGLSEDERRALRPHWLRRGERVERGDL